MAFLLFIITHHASPLVGEVVDGCTNQPLTVGYMHMHRYSNTRD